MLATLPFASGFWYIKLHEFGVVQVIYGCILSVSKVVALCCTCFIVYCFPFGG